MIKNDLVVALEKNTNLSRSKAISLVEAIIKYIKKGLVTEGAVEIRGFGSFRVLNKKTGIGRDIRRQRRVLIAEGKRIKFCCGRDLKAINLKTQK